jgi:glyoxylase-like metal-dependent hydrolase (beta-lactamase superfamily II)
MKIIRTPRLSVVLATLLAGVCANAQDFAEVEIRIHPVSGQVHHIEGRGGNIGLFIGEDGVFLIDDQFAVLTDRIVAAIRTLSDKPIRFLVNTHMHPDHTGGNENFGKMGTLIFGHDNVNLSFHINGETVHVFKTPNAHTDGDSFIHFTGSNVIHAGDVYRTTTYPYIDTEHGGSFLGTIEAMRLLIETANAETKIIPGHGNVSDIAEAQVVLNILNVVRERVHAAISEGKSLEEAQAAGLTTEYDARWNTETGRGTSAALIAAAYADLAN